MGMNAQAAMKRVVEGLPEWLGRPLSAVPYNVRLGSVYSRTLDELRGIGGRGVSFEELREMVVYCATNVPFYQRFYRSKGFNAQALRSWDDWKHVPVVTKADLQSVSLQERTAMGAKGLKLNTGGTSGQALEFLVDTKAFAREWAHMHYIWFAQGYRPEHAKLTLRGRHYSDGRPLRYNAVHNEYVGNEAVPMEELVRSVIDLSKKVPIRWIHGYPSLVHEFAIALGNVGYALDVGRFRRQLHGVLLGSEFPAPMYRSVIEGELSTNVVSWYGQSEMVLLARETANGVYCSFPSYGYCELVGEGGSQRLVGTSIHNRVHPFVRYDTADLAVPLVQEPMGHTEFRITEGRVGDFIVDRHGRRHSLTAIIFGRHHEAFQHVRHVQVCDQGGGSVVLIVTPRESCKESDTLIDGFDLRNLDVSWRVMLVDEPIRTASGKIKLKVDKCVEGKLLASRR